MSSSVMISSNPAPNYAKRKLEVVPFSSQLEIIEKAILNNSRTLLNSNQYTNVHRSGYNNNGNNNNHSYNQKQQNKYALAAVAAASAVQQQQNYMIQQPQQSSQQQYKDINPYTYQDQNIGFNKTGGQGELSSTSSLLSENNAQLPYEFQNNFISSNGSNNSVSSPTTAPLNQPPPIELQTHQFQSHAQPQLQSLSQPPMRGFVFDPMASDNSKVKPNSPTSLQPQIIASSNKASRSSPPNLFLSTSTSGQNAMNVNSNNSVGTNFLDSPSLLPNVNKLSNNWAASNPNTNAINHTSIWGANPSLSSSSMIPSNLTNLDSKSESKMSIQNNFGGSMW